MPVYFFGVRKRHRYVDGNTRKYSYRLIWAQSKNAIIDELKLGFGFSDIDAKKCVHQAKTPEEAIYRGLSYWGISLDQLKILSAGDHAIPCNLLSEPEVMLNETRIRHP